MWTPCGWATRSSLGRSTVLDWLEHDADFFSERLGAQLSPGAIFLLHDSLYRLADPRKADRSAVIAAVEALLRARPDYLFVTVPTLLEHGPKRKTMWFKKPDPDWLAQVDPLGLASNRLVSLGSHRPCPK